MNFPLRRPLVVVMACEARTADFLHAVDREDEVALCSALAGPRLICFSSR
jgi:hypothetical protein